MTAGHDIKRVSTRNILSQFKKITSSAIVAASTAAMLLGSVAVFAASNYPPTNQKGNNWLNDPPNFNNQTDFLSGWKSIYTPGPSLVQGTLSQVLPAGEVLINPTSHPQPLCYANSPSCSDPVGAHSGAYTMVGHYDGPGLALPMEAGKVYTFSVTAKKSTPAGQLMVGISNKAFGGTTGFATSRVDPTACKHIVHSANIINYTIFKDPNNSTACRISETFIPTVSGNFTIDVQGYAPGDVIQVANPFFTQSAYDGDVSLYDGNYSEISSSGNDTD